jgi:hypothetical protein
MQFSTPAPGINFEIPDEWWTFVEIEGFAPAPNGFYPPNTSDCVLLDLAEVEPPSRNAGVPLFKKEKFVPVLFAMRSEESTLPPIQVLPRTLPGRYRFRVFNGFHRFYASAAVGFARLPAVILDRDPASFF